MDAPQANLIALARAAVGAEKDSDLAPYLLVVAGSVLSAWRLGRTPMPDQHVLTLAKIAGVDPLLWLALVNSDKARLTDCRMAWRALAERLQSAP